MPGWSREEHVCGGGKIFVFSFNYWTTTRMLVLVIISKRSKKNQNPIKKKKRYFSVLFPSLWMEGRGEHHRTKPFLSDKNHSKTPAHPLQINQPYELLLKFQPYLIFFVCFIQAGFAGRGFCNRSTDTALTRLSAEPWSLLEVASSPSKWEAEGNTDAGDVAPCRDSRVLQVTLHQDTEPREQPYGYGERRRRTVRRRGRSGNRKTIRKLPGNQVFSSSLGKH